MLERGYKAEQIAEKIGVDKAFAYGIVQLLKQGESDLLQEVDAGRLPLRIAIIISNGTNDEVQTALMEGYQTGDLRGSKLERVRRIAAMRLTRDRKSGRTIATKKKLSAGVLIEEYEQHVQNQRSAVARLSAVSHRLMILSTAMKRVLQDENFVTLLRAESIEDIPSHLADRIG